MNVTYRLRPRTAQAIAEQARQRGITRAEFLDRLCLRAKLYDETVEVTQAELDQLAEEPTLREQLDEHTHSKASLSTSGAPKCRCGSIYMNEEWR